MEKADKILVMKDGKLTGEGTHSELLLNCLQYKEMVDANERRDKWTVKRMEVTV